MKFDSNCYEIFSHDLAPMTFIASMLRTYLRKAWKGRLVFMANTTRIGN